MIITNKCKPVKNAQYDIFYDACLSNDIETIMVLIKHQNINPNFVVKYKKQLLLHILCEKNQKEYFKIIDILLKNGIDINTQNEHGNTALHIVCFNNNLSLCKLLLKYFPDLNIQNNNGETPLHLSAQYNNFELTKLLLEHGINVNIIDNKGNNALHYACKNNNKDMIILLLNYGSNCLQNNNDNNTPTDLIENKDLYQTIISEIALKYNKLRAKQHIT